jgi:hypothetical protein
MDVWLTLSIRWLQLFHEEVLLTKRDHRLRREGAMKMLVSFNRWMQVFCEGVLLARRSHGL